MNKLDVGHWITLALAAAGVVASFAVMQFQVNALQVAVGKMEQQPLELALLQADVKRLRCDIGNVKRLLKSQPERDCLE